MKDYGRDGRLKSEKKKKRKFEVIMNTGIHGIHSDFSLRKVAKKATMDLARKNKHIIFHLREKRKSGKTYGPYIGNIKDGKAIVRIHKMSGGVEPIFSNEEKRSFFAKNGDNQIKIIKKEDKYFICCFGISSSSNYKYFVYFDENTRGINFYKINDNLTFEEVDITSIDSRLLLTLMQLLENKKNGNINSINNSIINIIIAKIKEKVPKIKEINNTRKNIQTLQSINNGCIFNSPSVKDFKASPTAQRFTIKRKKFCMTRRTLLFCNKDNFLIKDGISYYQYVIYGERNNVLLLELINNNGKLEKTKIKISDSDIGKETLERIRNEIMRVRWANTKNKDFAEKILKVVEAEIDRQSQQSQQSQQPQQPSFSSFSNKPIQQMPPHVYSRLLNNALPIQNPSQQPQEKSINRLNSSSFINKPKIIRNNQKFFNYICSTQNPILEITKNDAGIFFGYDPNLIDQLLFFYKYLYRNNQFYELKKYDNGALYESPIEQSKIPLYDLLCLYEFAKNNSLSELLQKIKEIILRKNKSETVSESKDTIISSLSDKNFTKEKNTNIGRTKGKIETFKRKTYYFFGNSSGKFLYVCFRESDGSNENVYYYDRQNLNEKRKPLSDLQDINALQDLKSFIILRQMQDPKFGGEIVCEKAGEIIRKIKAQQLQIIMQGPKKFPNFTGVVGNNFKPSQPKSILPSSPSKNSSPLSRNILPSSPSQILVQ